MREGGSGLGRIPRSKGGSDMTQCSLSGENSTIQVEGAGCLTRPPLGGQT